MKKKIFVKNYIKTYWANIFYFILSIPLILIIIIINPLVKIKIGELQSRKIGAFSSSIEIYLNELKAKIINKKKNEIHLFYCNYKVCNRYLLSHWKKKIIILPRVILEPIDFFFNNFDCFKKFIINLIRVDFVNDNERLVNFPVQADVNDILYKYKTSITFNNEEILKGEKFLSQLGLNLNQKIICFANRDEAFSTDKIISTRNANISTYKKAIQYLANKNFFCIRMGRLQNEKIDFNQNNIVDYAFDDLRSDFMDLFISSKCIFFISTGHGIAELATLFRKKRLIINFQAPDRIHWLGESHTPMVILKKFKNLKENKFISFKEVYEKQLHLISITQLKSLGYELIDNNEEEILDATKDMYELYNNNFKIELSDQKKFWSLYEKYFDWRPTRMMIGKTFFKKNCDLFI